MEIPLDFPSLNGVIPEWTGNGFLLDEKKVPVLDYGSNLDGWNDDLTTFHEEEAGSRHPIDIASRLQALEVLQKNSVVDGVILEIGCSAGHMLSEIKSHFPKATLIGADVIKGTLLALARRMPEVPLLCFDLSSCPLADNSVDAVIMLNVLEHIEDDLCALRHANRVLRPGGVLVLEVPASPDLYDEYDAYLKHFRRYSKQDIRDKLVQAGFSVNRISHLGFFLFPLFWLVKKIGKKNLLKGYSEEKAKRRVSSSIKGSSNVIVKSFFRLERLIGEYVCFPAGIRIVVDCIKK